MACTLSVSSLPEASFSLVDSLILGSCLLSLSSEAVQADVQADSEPAAWSYGGGCDRNPPFLAPLGACGWRPS